jgi:3'(2'), 5'-bisphosphate nucleotidase
MRMESVFQVTAYQHELTVALEAAALASRLILDEYAQFVRIPDAPANISTDTDRHAQECIIKHLQAAFPQDAMLAEESTPGLFDDSSAATRTWIIDPIDGSRGFARKNGEFSVMIALMDGSHIALGVVAEPVGDRLTFATRGGGCWTRAGAENELQACRVTQVLELDRATVTQSHSRDPEEPSKYIRALSPAQVIETYSSGIKLAQVACGVVDIYLNTYAACHDWDICAGVILVEEAGGQVTNLRGESPRFGLPGAIQPGGLLASNGLLHQKALAALKEL